MNAVKGSEPQVHHVHAVTDGIGERTEHGVVLLFPEKRPALRRVLFVNLYGGKSLWEQIKSGVMPPHHLWGCLELVRMGYEVALAEPVWNFEYRRAFPHDLKLFKLVREWLRPADIVYCGHNVLFWIPLLKRLGLVRSRIVSLLYAREPLDFAKAHSGIIALNPAAEDHAKKVAPNVKITHLGWGADLGYFPRIPYSPEWFLSCGITHRDHRTLSEAASICGLPIRMICPGLPEGLSWPSNVELIDGGAGWNFQKSVVSYNELLHGHYANCAASIISLTPDPVEYTACGFTNLIEAMAMGRPIIMTRTGAVPREIDLEKAGCGLFVPPGDPAALADAIKTLNANPKRAQEMGEKARQLAEGHYNIQRYALGLHQFFESL